MPLTLSDVIDEPEATQAPDESDYEEDEISSDERSKQAAITTREKESEDIKNELAVPEIEKILKASPGKVDGLAKNLSLFDEEEEEMDDSHHTKVNRDNKELDEITKKNLTPVKARLASQYSQSPLPNAEFTMLQQKDEDDEEEAFASNISPSFEMPFNTQQSQAMFNSKSDQSPVPSLASLKSFSPKKTNPSPSAAAEDDENASDSYSESEREDGEEEETEDAEEEFADHPDPLRLDQISDQKLTRKDINRLKWWSYLIVLDKTDSTTWKLPYRDGLGRLNRPLLARARFILTSPNKTCYPKNNGLELAENGSTWDKIEQTNKRRQDTKILEPMNIFTFLIYTEYVKQAHELLENTKICSKHSTEEKQEK